MSPNAPRSEGGFVMGLKGDHSGYGTQDEMDMKMALDDFDATQYQTQMLEQSGTPQVSRTLRGPPLKACRSTKNRIGR